MGLSHIEPGYTDKAAPIMEERGGKIGSTQFIKAYDPELASYLLSTVVIPSDKSEITLDDIENRKIPTWILSFPIIIRASHKNDFQGLIDVLPTEIIINNNGSGIDKLERINLAIRSIRDKCASCPVRRYAKYENPDYDGKVTIGIQPLNYGDRAVVMEHPNRPGCFVVTYSYVDVEESCSDPSFGRFVTRGTSSGLVDENGNVLRDYYVYREDALRTSVMVEIVKRIKKLGLVRDDLEPQIEFGITPRGEVLIYQVRVLTQKRIADFTVDGGTLLDFPLVMGVTEGMELPLVFGNNMRDPSLANFTNGKGCAPYALMKTKHVGDRRDTALWFRPVHMDTYLGSFSHGFGSPGLQHGQSALIQKADVSLFESGGSRVLLKLLGKDVRDELKEGRSGVKVRIATDAVRTKVELVT